MTLEMEHINRNTGAYALMGLKNIYLLPAFASGKMPRSIKKNQPINGSELELERQTSIVKPQITYTRSSSYHKRHDTTTTEDEENTFLGKDPAEITCQFCSNVIITEVEKKSARQLYSDDDWYMNNCGYVVMLACAPIWLFIPCCYLFSRKPWRMTTHKCPTCNVYIGVYTGKKTKLFRKPGSSEEQFDEYKRRKVQRRSSI